MSKRSRYIVSLLMSVMLVFVDVQPTQALSGGDWRAGRVIDDAIFYNKSSMSIDQIQQFLNAKMPNCDTWGTGMYAGRTRRAYLEERGVVFPLVCLKDYHENPENRENNLQGRPIPAGAKSAANIIWDAAQQYGINPQVLIVLLQKEQGMILDDWPWFYNYRTATGYGCPDTAACDSQYYGFYNQIQNAARQFRRYATYPNEYNHMAGRNNSVRFNPQSVCGSSTVYIENTATASLYNYTPYQPNQAALNNLYGTGDACSAYGNRNFWRDFNNWFGVSFGDGFVLAISDDPGDLRQWVLYGTIKQYIPDSQTKLAWNLQDAQLVTMSSATLNGISTGPTLDRLARHNGGLIYFMDGGKRYKMPWEVLLDTWNLRGTTISSVSHGLFHQTADGGEMSFSIKDPASSTVYMPEGSNGSGQTILRPFANATVQQAWEGTSRATEVSVDYWDRINDAIGPSLTSTKITHGGSEYEVVGTYRLALSGSTSSLYPATAQSVSAVTINRLIPAGNAPVFLRAIGNSTTYMIDGGTRHSITNADVFASWTAGSRVVEVNSSFMSLIPEGAPLTSYLTKTGSQSALMVGGKKMIIPAQLLTAYENAFPVYTASSTLMDNFSVGPVPTGFIKGATSPQVYLLDNSGKRRHLEWADKVTSWGGYRIGVITLPESVVNSIGTAGSPQTFVSNGTTNYVMDDGKKYAVPANTQTAWGLASPQVYNDGTLDRFEDGGNLQIGFRAGDGYYVVRDGVSHGTGDRAIAEAWAIEESSRYSTGIFSLLRNFMLTRYVKSSVPGDDRIFLVDKGQWYNLPPAQQRNLRVGTQSKVIMNPSNAPNTITDLASPVVKNASNAAFVIDDGGKRYFPHPMIYDQWTNFGQITVPTMSNGLLDSLPNRGLIERAIKGTSEPMVYSVEAGKKRHILYPDVFTRSYAPMVEVSDALIDTLPSGPSISQ